MGILQELGNEDPAVWLAAFYHDAVYDPQSPTNEEDSVIFMREALLRLGIAPSPEAEALILATKTHRAETSGQERLLDADLAILGAERPRYEAYAQAIREEYVHVPQPAYRAGRAAILHGFLGRERIYHSPNMAAYEARARKNLKWEIEALA